MPIVACGGTAILPEDGGTDRFVPVDASPDGPSQGDAVVPSDAAPGLDGEVDASFDGGFDGASDASFDGATDAGGDVTTTSCTPPTFPDAGPPPFDTCRVALCPAGTVCVQKDGDLTSTAHCVGIPPACMGSPSCACMGAAAKSCIEEDAGPVTLGCEDVTDDAGTTYLEFPCGCASRRP